MQLYADPTELTAQVSALLASEAEPSVFLLRLGLLLSSCGDDSITRLRSDLQEVFGEEMAQADRPLALQAEQLELCHHHIEAAPETERRSSSCRRRCAAGMRQSSRPAPRASSSGPLPWSTAAMPPRWPIVTASTCRRPIAGDSCWAGVVPHREVRLGWRQKA
jgi:hypothetical protein